MTRHTRLQATAAALEDAGAVQARVLAEGLLRPTADRPDLTAAAAAFSALRSEAQAVARRLRVPPAAASDAAAPADGLKGFRARAAHWKAVDRAVAICLSGRDWPLLPERTDRYDLAAIQADVVSRVFTWAHCAITPMEQDEAADAYGCFSDIATPAGSFAVCAHLAYRLWLARKHPGPLRFVDVGCGGGMKVALASAYFDECDGIEYDPGYAEAARRALTAMYLRRCAITEADALAHDRYGDYEVIYFYRPMRDNDLLRELENRIVAMAAPGTVLIAPYLGFHERSAALGCPAVANGVYLCRMPETTADDWAAEARRMGPDVAGKIAPPPPRLGWLRPLWLACAANGIRPG